MKRFLLLILFLSGIYASEYNLALVYKNNIYGNYKFIGNTVLEVNKNINYPSIYLNGKYNRVVIYDDGNHIIAKDRYNNICVFPKKDKNGNIVDISKKQKEYNFGNNNYIHFYDNYYKVEVKCNSNEFSVKKNKKKAQWTKFKNGCLKGHSYNNNFCYLKYIDIYNNSSTFDSSSSDLTLPNGSKIVYAGLYWSGLIDKNEKKLDKAKHVLLKINDGNYIPLYTNNNNSKNDNNDSFYYTTKSSGYVYSAFKNITDELKKYNDTLTKITVANVMAEEGINVNIGNFGAWALVVVYKNSEGHLKNIVIYNSFLKFYKNNKIIQVKDILTPINGKVYSKLSYFTVEGDIKSPKYRKKSNKNSTDKVEIKTNKTNYINVSPNENNVSAPNYYLDIMDSSITTKENRTPEIENNMGIDIDTFDVGKDGNNSHKQILDNNITSVDIKITTGNDTFFLNSVVFATDLYQPRVCYYIQSIKDSSGKTIYTPKNGFKNRIFPNEKYKINMYISNEKDKNETTISNAKYVKVQLTYKDFNYTKESTYIKNIGENIFKYITDSKDNDIGEYLSDKNMSRWRLGKGANNVSGGEIDVGQKAYIDFNGSFNLDLNNTENNATVDLLSYFEFKASYQVEDLGIELKGVSIPKCKEFNLSGNIGVTNGVFDAWDTDKNISDRNITTKIVNKEFNLTIVSLNQTNDGLETAPNKETRFVIWDMDHNVSISNVNEFNASDSSSKEYNFTINRACKNARVRFKFCAEIIGGNYYFRPFSSCSNDCKNSNDTSKCFRYKYSTGNFAIRPDRFIIRYIPPKIKAGEDFNVTVIAAEYNSTNPSADYNETLKIKKINNSNSPSVEYNETKSGCKKGKLLIKPANTANFVNGEANVTLNYDEVGDINLTIKEINGSEFAKVDTNDTNWTLRKITEANTTLSILPYEFNISATYKNANNSNFTYISNDLNMSSILDLDIKAVNANGTVTSNYNKQCYAKKLDINITHSDVNISSDIIYKDENGPEHNVSKNSDINLTNLTKDYFTTDHNGSADIKIYINFEKNYTNPSNEFNFIIKDINVSDVNGTFGQKTLDGNATFRYGRIKVSDASSYSSDISNTFEYQYWSNEGWKVNTEHNSSIFGDFNHTLNTSVNPFVSVTNTPVIKNGKEEVIFHTIHSRPYSAKVHLSIPSWLWYNPLAKSYKDPSVTNRNCLTHPCLKLNFLKSGSAWGGVSAVNNAKFSESNRTSEVNASTKEINVSKSQVKKINW